jgi:hypothetical protein
MQGISGSNQCPLLWFKTQPVIMGKKTFIASSQITQMFGDGTQDYNAKNC